MGEPKTVRDCCLQPAGSCALRSQQPRSMHRCTCLSATRWQHLCTCKCAHKHSHTGGICTFPYMLTCMLTNSVIHTNAQHDVSRIGFIHTLLCIYLHMLSLTHHTHSQARAHTLSTLTKTLCRTQACMFIHAWIHNHICQAIDKSPGCTEHHWSCKCGLAGVV